MNTHCVNATEDARLASLYAFDVLDTGPEEAFDRITRIAKTVLQVPISTVTFVDRDRQWFKSRQGIDATESPRDISFCTRAIELDEPLIVPDARLDPRFKNSPLVTGSPWVRFYIGVQLKDRDGFNVGTLCCIDTEPRIVTAHQVAVLHDLARLVVDELELRLLATTDGLTGAMTRRAFMDAANRDVALAKRHGRALSVLMIDADHFKSVNDSYGHATGDQVLRVLAKICRSQLRASDYLGRIGGEEFALVLPETTGFDACDVAERLLGLVAREIFSAGDNRFTVTLSVGVAGLGQPCTNASDLLEQADAALYRAKIAGRNRVVLHEARPARHGALAMA